LHETLYKLSDFVPINSASPFDRILMVAQWEGKARKRKSGLLCSAGFKRSELGSKENDKIRLKKSGKRPEMLRLQKKHNFLMLRF